MKPDAPDAPAFTPFVKALSFAVKQMRLYAASHPITKQSLDTLGEEIEKFFAGKDRITLGSMQGVLVVDGALTGEKDAAAKDLARELGRLNVEGLTFEKGITLAEMAEFLGWISTRSKTLEQKGGFKKMIEDHAPPHIKVVTGKYELIEEGEQVTRGEGGEEGVEDGSAAPPARKGKVSSIADIIHRIREEHGTPSAPKPEEVNAEQVITQIEKNPQEMARMALESSSDAPGLENVIRKIARFLVEGMVSYLVENGKDITKALEKLSKELEKGLSRSGEGADFAELRKKIPRIFEEAADDLRVEIVVKTFQKDPKDSKNLHKIIEKILKDPVVRKRLGPALREDLSHQGLPGDSFDDLLETIDTKEAKKKSRVTVDAEELQELRRKAATFDKDIEKKLTSTVKRLEREKKQVMDEKERVDTVIRNLAEGLLVVDKDGKVVLMNPAAERLLGVKQKDKIGKPVADGLKEEQLLAMASGNLRDQEGDIAKNVELVSINDETKRIVQASTAVVENEDGKTVGMVTVLSDVTRQKELEELKTKFVSNVSHELRTPLVAIQKSLSLILGKELGEVNPEQQRFLDIANRSIGRLSRLINDLLDVSKLEAGAMRLKIEKCDVREIVTHVTAALENWAKDKKVGFKVQYGEGISAIDADQDRLTQVLMNLAGNAIKYSPDEGTITFEVKPVTEGGVAFMEVGVRDMGIGIAPADQVKIFDKFVQVSLAQPAGISSTGLGLTIAKEIIDLHRGKIWVESEPEKGSRFAFRVPVQYREVKAEA